MGVALLVFNVPVIDNPSALSSLSFSEGKKNIDSGTYTHAGIPQTHPVKASQGIDHPGRHIGRIGGEKVTDQAVQ